MKHSLHSLRLHARVVALTAILLTLWLNLAFVEHQLDVTPSHHAQHHCQLFSAAHHGVAAALPELPVWIEHEYLQPVATPLSVTLLYLAYLARSPPTSSFTKDHDAPSRADYLF
ncbi:DUF2607 domain-containing protein [Vibrio furnissii]|uniref:DUF2607 family protein n=1 Tax=Vibrio furnissii TaxID=29494 RepID=UPI0013029F34|nr:DUF2607 family protein [Vibrio furnissii]MCG6213908.1 DUF2607 domain-containing protein [Vibrio furnissii]WJG25857.1 DUF2607 family protein [Vibrio furnissii]